MAERKFQEGTVGSTNVIEGMVINIENPYEQLVNYVDFDFSAKQADWVEEGGTFEYSSSGISQALGGTKGSIVDGSWKYKKLFIPTSLSKDGFEIRCTHKMYTSSNTNMGNMLVKFYSSTEQKVAIQRTDAWGAVKNQSHLINTTGVKDADAFVAILDNSSLNNTVRRDIVSYNGTTIKASLHGTVGSTDLPLETDIDEIQIWFGGQTSSNYAVAQLVISELMVFTNDDWQTLASKAGITATSIDDVLSASNTLLANRNAVNFMTAQCTGNFMINAVENSTFLTALETSPYKTLIQSNEHWSKFLAMVA